MRQTFFKTLVELASNDDRIFLIIGDLGYGQVEEFARTFPKQFLNVGVAEQNMTGVASGLALCGKIVFTYSIGNFPTLRCLEQIRNNVCYHNLRVNIAAVGGGYAYGGLGMSHHATEDLAIMRSLPHMTVVSPGDAFETKSAVKSMIATPGPHYIRLSKAPDLSVDAIDKDFQLGKARLIREGADITLICTGSMLETAVNISRRLSNNGIEARVLSMHTISPLDSETILESAARTRIVVCIEEHSVIGGLGSAVADVISVSNLHDVRFKKIALPASFCDTCGSRDFLIHQCEMSEDDILSSIQDVL